MNRQPAARRHALGLRLTAVISVVLLSISFATLFASPTLAAPSAESASAAEMGTATPGVTPSPSSPPVSQWPVISTATPPTGPSAPTPPVHCVSNASLVADVALASGGRLKPGTGFVKIWRVRNTGTCVWEAHATVVADGGDRMSSASRIELPSRVLPGEDIDFAIQLRAPTTIGQQVGYWRLKDSAGEKFGDRLAVTVLVAPDAAAPGVAGTPSPATGAAGVRLDEALAWASVISDGPITYRVLLGTSEAPSQVVPTCDGITATTCAPPAV
jgi:Ig-like domain from next to BRCA1 gene